MNWSLAVGEPWWLILLALVPVLWWIGHRSLSGLGRFRKFAVLELRSALVILIVLALADLQGVQTSDRTCVNFILDYSESVSADQLDAALAAVSQAAGTRKPPDDLAGLVVVGGDAKLDVAPWAGWKPNSLRGVTSTVDRQSTDLAAGIRMGLACLPPDAAGRLVLLSDGNQNHGNVLAEAMTAKRRDIPIDVIALDYKRGAEVMVDKLVLPSRLNVGDTVRLKVILRSNQPTSGLLRLDRIFTSGRQTVLEEKRELKEGLNVLTVTTPFPDADTYKFEAEFVPDLPADDRFAQNNRAGAFTIVDGPGRILLVESRPGEQETLARALREADLAVVRMTAESLPRDVEFYRMFDTVVIADVSAAQLEEPLQQTIAASTRELGTGLVVVGGPNSYGPGGYQQSPLEEAMPVDCEIKSNVLNPKVAIVLVIDRSGSMAGDKLAMAIMGAKASVDLISADSQLGVIAFDGQPEWIRHLLPLGNPDLVKRRLSTITLGGGTDMFPALQAAADALKRSDAMVRHIVALSDGQSMNGDWNNLIAYCKRNKITLTTVAVGDDSDRQLMRRLAIGTGGRFHFTRSARAVPGIYSRETKLVSRPLIFERPQPWSPVVTYPTEAVQGLPREMPPIRGFVLTTPKPTADVSIVSPIPAENEVNPILASWQYGLGRSVAVTTDAGNRWTNDWTESNVYGKFWSQVIRSSMRSSMQSSEGVNIAVQEEDGEVVIVADATEAEQAAVAPTQISGNILRPDGTVAKLDFRSREPGRYSARFPTNDAGSYIVSVKGASPDGKQSHLSAGVSIPYSREYRDWRPNKDLLANVAALTDGKVVDLSKAESIDFFRRDRPPAYRLREIWPLILLIALVVFLADVATRRIAVQPSDIAKQVSKVWGLLRRRTVAEPAPAIDRLRARKEEVKKTFERPPSLRPVEDRTPVMPSVSATKPTSAPASPPPVEESPPADAETAEESSTSRLLRAKRRVWEDRENRDGK